MADDCEDERTTLFDYLDHHRKTLVRKVEGLTDEQAKSTPVSISLFGLLGHMTMVERYWFTEVVAGLDADFPWTDDDPDADWRGPEGATLAEMVAVYEAECERSRAIMTGVDLDRVVTHPERGGMNVRNVVVHMVEETARHNGHADILRELVDGSVGV